METTQTLVNEICPTTTQVWVKRGAMLVDVRERDEVEQLSYDVPNMVNISLSEFEIRYMELPMDKEMVMVCRSGGRNLRAGGFLINNGYNALKVVNMRHGITRWVQKGFPTKGDTTAVTESNTGSGCCAGSSLEKKANTCCGSSNRDATSCC